MAQRSARARSKLDKITQQNEERAGQSGGGGSSSLGSRRSTYGRGGLGGGARLGSGGLLTPSASSVSGSSRNSLQSAPPPRIGKTGWKSLFDVHGDRWKRGLGGGHKKEGSENTFYAGLGGGLRDGLSSMSTIGEEKIQVKRWEGGGGIGEVWDGFGKDKKMQDLELWFQDGDTLVYLSEKPVASRNTLNAHGLYKPATLQPSFRLRSSVLKQFNSPYLMMRLEEASLDRPESSETQHIAPSLSGSQEGMDFEYELKRSRTIETTASSAASVNTTHTAETGIKHRLYFPAPSMLDKEALHRYHLTTRNFFAMIYNKSLVGTTLGQSLKDLVERTDQYLAPPVTPMAYEMADRGVGEVESLYGSYIGPSLELSKAPSQPATLRIILDYIIGKEFDDVRNSPENSAGLLFWSEWVCKSAIEGRIQMSAQDLARAESIWRESFVHCTGQLAHLHGQSEWRDISPITKAFADRASLEIQVRASKADTRLASFNYADMWPVSPTSHPPARVAFDKFQKFLLKHYHSRFGSWPPQEGRFTRTLYVHLQRDFTALYDYLVDRDAVWCPPHNEPAQSRRIVKNNLPSWRADDETLPIADMLIQFDNNENHPLIPHPFPLVPALPSRHSNISASTASPKAKRHTQSFFAATSGGLRGRTASNPATALALSESTNIEALYSSKAMNPLVEAFNAHEKSVSPTEISLHDARKGRWILIYGVLQTLASIAVDAPGIKWTDGVDYPLNPRLRGTPPWKHNNPPPETDVDERSHFRSHCWITARPTASTPHGQSVSSQPVTGSAMSMSTMSASLPHSHAIRHRGSRKELQNRSRSRKRLERPAPMELEDHMDVEARRSGDEGDDEDEMDAPQSPISDFGSPPPQPLSESQQQSQSKANEDRQDTRSRDEVDARTRISSLLSPLE